MKKIITFGIAALLISGASFAGDGKKKASGKSCCNKKDCKKEMKEAPKAATVKKSYKSSAIFAGLFCCNNILKRFGKIKAFHLLCISKCFYE